MTRAGLNKTVSFKLTDAGLAEVGGVLRSEETLSGFARAAFVREIDFRRTEAKKAKKDPI